MPNHIKNRLTFTGNPARVYQLVKQFTTKVPASIHVAHDGSAICFSSEGDVGWLDLGTGAFSRREKKDVIGLPQAFKVSINEGVNNFPDLNKIIPMPTILEGTTSPNDVNKKECMAATGYEDWYAWQVANWKVKWGTYDHEQTDWNVFEFDTAWRNIVEMISFMHREFQDVEILYEWSDEDTGSNCGYAVYKSGKMAINKFENGSQAAYEMAFKLRPDYKDNYELVDGEYQYKED